MVVRLAGIPLRIRLSFLVVISLLGMPMVRGFSVAPAIMVARLGLWLVVVTTSVIIHELGHALLARRFGATVAMELWALGGLTSWKPGATEITPAKRTAIAAAGSALGVVVGAAAYPLWKMAGTQGELLYLTLGWIVWVNLGWGLINWLPIRLLDGGHIFRGIIDLLWPARAESIAHVFFMFSSAAATLLALRFGLPIAALFGAAMLLAEIRRIPRFRPRRRRPVQHPPRGNFLLTPPDASETGEHRQAEQ